MTVTATDFSQFAQLRGAAGNNDPAALREVANQFEALFVQSMLESMRDASLGDPLFGSDQHDLYQGMMDEQLALEMTSGKGIGLADMLVRQMGGEDALPFSPSRVEVNHAAPSSSVPPTWSDPNDFVRDIWPHAEKAGRSLGVSPHSIVAHAALETGWGAHVMSNADGGSSLNLFGIKAGGSWSGDNVSKQTLELQGDSLRPEMASFRTYTNVADTFADYTQFIKRNPRYDAVQEQGTDTQGFANALQASGYATDPNYAEKLSRVAESPTMRRALKNLPSAPINVGQAARAR